MNTGLAAPKIPVLLDLLTQLTDRKAPNWPRFPASALTAEVPDDRGFSAEEILARQDFRAEFKVARQSGLLTSPAPRELEVNVPLLQELLGSGF